ncbi:hypothetical protein IFM89_019245 [Coptis chinensis]|uniref:Uncharacterized protein n=1 Tax=Coptis chinensis TaxID=261450 RepID=A0A835HNB7_9MAGN|nr:hypothetical protein IFM89_019245 [Coptis chinensis]
MKSKSDNSGAGMVVFQRLSGWADGPCLCDSNVPYFQKIATLTDLAILTEQEGTPFWWHAHCSYHNAPVQQSMARLLSVLNFVDILFKVLTWRFPNIRKRLLPYGLPGSGGMKNLAVVENNILTRGGAPSGSPFKCFYHQWSTRPPLPMLHRWIDAGPTIPKDTSTAFKFYTSFTGLRTWALSGVLARKTVDEKMFITIGGALLPWGRLQIVRVQLVHAINCRLA